MLIDVNETRSNTPACQAPPLFRNVREQVAQGLVGYLRSADMLPAVAVIQTQLCQSMTPAAVCEFVSCDSKGVVGRWRNPALYWFRQSRSNVRRPERHRLFEGKLPFRLCRSSLSDTARVIVRQFTVTTPGSSDSCRLAVHRRSGTTTCLQCGGKRTDLGFAKMLSSCGAAPLLTSALLLFGCVTTYHRAWIASSLVPIPAAINANGTELLHLDVTHAPYVNSSYLQSRWYRGVCVLDGCKVSAANASALAARPACTPETLKARHGAGKWFRAEDGHFR